MKNLQKLLSHSLLLITLMFTTSFAANAGLINIKHDIIGDFYGKMGSIEVQIDDSLLNTGLLYKSFGDQITLVNISLFGLFSSVGEFDISFFDVGIDSDNIYAGIEFFEFDANDVGFGADTWNYYMIFDAFTFGSLEIFDLNNDFIAFDTFSLSAAQVVPAPSTLVLLMLGMGGLMLRRKRII
ncbi:PEP-CTERM sorting domain-containing protein [Alishewanella sp. 16-MA]|uniref:PEP-CTERM sorting domain-containing protein n=1 Tax=Alishewanella maricola TaxID=2795740 RepID=A0ABS8C3D0_9ALTE|nr:PEP-CTERM sorting domain-containing protein [Alishewanella maricola]MCB5226505.1 PEP-CTERM sorting domain-containing protein [Alishewanella maricola]